MNKIFAISLLFFAAIANSHAAQWVKLQDNNGAKLMLDKQSVLEVDKLKRAWIKIAYKTPQTNIEVAEKTYNLSKLLWFFDCTTQKAATSQVFQFSNDELIYSAAVDSKMAKFIEPVPETEIDVVMRYVCGVNLPTEVAEEKPATEPVKAVKPEQPKSEVEAETEAKEPKTDKKGTAAEKPALSKAKVVEALTSAATKSEKIAIKPVVETKPKPEVKSAGNKHWTYEGKEGPEFWGKLSSDYMSCDLGRNQSPINIDKTVQAVLKPLKTFQRFPASDVVNNGHTIQVNFKPGNMVVLDTVLYHLRQMHFHSPSENTIRGKSYPLEAHFVHEDAKGNLTVVAVMFEEGKANDALTRVWQQMSAEINMPSPLKSRVVPSELSPQSSGYYRYSGSLTTPPCSEGVSWIVMKTPMTASKTQIDAFKNVVHHDNNRPVQALNGRMIVE
jgi:carbonic anhydrase